ncbi:phosphoribosylglycinamide formyltransferase [Candidatus Photodesmus katoptron]|uniref:Phosphoribosylglycinamide formyltransferase n=1 Tax=Candidatus Photodesmus katoptron Akat1 TaxID=1236703 RepID=S3DZV3_9GAMM|nr:phosphoribosylglycinamide formyltransferase [Candidatus Photodesmus katoptron Akat1]KEY90325.1 phosphoribosylglycinamide formyltransferase [Candidatus Photodesmus katoptron]
MLVSGYGSNLQAIINVSNLKTSKFKVAAVLSDKASCYALERAKKANITDIFINPEYLNSKKSFDKELIYQVDKFKPALIVLAGYMRILSGFFVRHYFGRIINIHPSLLPKYPGLNTFQRVINSGEKEHGTTIHFVTEKIDSGPIIFQEKVPVFKDDTIQILSERVKTQENKIYPIVITWFIEGRLKMQFGKAFMDGKQLYINNSHLKLIKNVRY